MILDTILVGNKIEFRRKNTTINSSKMVLISLKSFVKHTCVIGIELIMYACLTKVLRIFNKLLLDFFEYFLKFKLVVMVVNKRESS